MNPQVEAILYELADGFCEKYASCEDKLIGAKDVLPATLKAAGTMAGDSPKTLSAIVSLLARLTKFSQICDAFDDANQTDYIFGVVCSTIEWVLVIYLFGNTGSGVHFPNALCDIPMGLTNVVAETAPDFLSPSRMTELKLRLRKFELRSTSRMDSVDGGMLIKNLLQVLHRVSVFGS